MARRAVISSPEESDHDERIQNNSLSTRRSRARAESPTALSPSPAASFSSDKENRSVTNTTRSANGKTQAMPPPSKLPTPNSAEPEAARASKRRRLSERDAPNAPDSAFVAEGDTPGNCSHYDPDQNVDERRAIRKDYRDLSRELTDSRAEFLTTHSDGLLKTLHKANDLFTNIKQTSDATLDSRLLVSTADLSVKKTQQLNIGDSTTGIDVNDFISKCITFMRKGDTNSRGAGSTQRRPRRNDDDHDSAAEDSADEGDAFNWEWLGRQACFPNNVRPPVPGFLLGPLSLQKRVRQPTQRRERLQKRDPKDVVRPEEIKAGDIERSENSNLTTLCRQIRTLLNQIQTDGERSVEEESTEDMSAEEIRELMAKHHMSDDGGVSLFRFVINPNSFGQTVENMFYVSFLIKEGGVGILFDSNQLPTLHVAETAEERKQRRDIQDIEEPGQQERHQAVLHLDFDTWEDLIEAFDIKESLIPHREAGQNQIGATGWYA
ncbi:MAG: hypothetical protein Q9195_004403 [Heterodermia aff. obscurata]